MSEIFKSAKPTKNPFEELEVVYVLYFDEAQGHIPLLIYPDDRYKDDKQFMRPIKYHPIWFLSMGETDVLDHIDLEYRGYTFFGKKVLVKSQRNKRRAGLEDETPETVVIIVSLPTKLEIFGDDLIRLLTVAIKKQFEDNIYEIIESEILKDEIIKSPKILKKIETGDSLKKELRKVIEGVTTNFFSNAIKRADPNSIKMQKAISYLSLKGIDISHIESKDYKGSFSSIQLFDPEHKSEPSFIETELFKIDDIIVMNDSQEFEILIQNTSQKELKNLVVKITHLKEYFEKEIMNTRVESWFSEEELVFISPIIPLVKEYLFFIIEEETQNKLFSKRIDLKLIESRN